MDSPVFQIVVPFLMSVIVILFFRKVDRERFHLSKIKRFTDSILNQFSGTVREKEKEVRARILELEEFSNKSKLLGDYLKKQIDLVNDRVSALQSQDGIIRRIENKSLQFESLNNDIEKKLHELQKEDNAINKINERVVSLEQNVSEIETIVPSLEDRLIEESKVKIKDINDKFKRDLDLLSEEVEDKASEALENFDQKTNLLLERQTTKINQLENKLLSFDSAVEESVNKYSLMKDSLLEDINARYNSLIKEFNDLKAEYRNNIAVFSENMGNIEKDFKSENNKYIEDVNIKLNSFSNFVNNMDSMAKDFEDRFSKELRDKIAIIDSDSNKKIEFLKSNLQNIENQIVDFMEIPTNKINTSIEELSKKLKQQIHTLENKVEDMDGKVINLGSNLKDRFNKDIEQLVYTLEEERRKITKQTNNINIYLDNFIDTEKDRITKDLVSHFNNAFVEQKELARNLNSLKKANEDLKKELEENTAYLTQGIEAANVSLREKITSGFEDLYYKIKEQKKASSIMYENMHNNIENMQNSIKDRILSDAKSINSIIEEKKTEIALFYEHNKSIIQDKNKELDYMISSIKDFYSTELERIVQSIKSNYAKVENDYVFNNTKLLKNTESQVKEIGKELDTLKGSFNMLVDNSANGIENQAQNYKRELIKFIDTIKERMQAKEDKIISRIDDKASNLNKNISVLETQLFNIKDNMIKEMTQYKDKSQDDIEQLISLFKDRIGNLNQELENRVSIKTDKIVVNIRSMVEGLEDELNTRIKSYIDSTELKVNNFDNEIKRIKNYDISVEDFNKRFDIELQRVATELMELKGKLSHETKEEFKKINAELSMIDERIEAFAKESRVFKKADKFYDKLKQEVHYASEQIKRIREEKEYFSDFDVKVDLLIQAKEQLKFIIAQAENKKQNLSSITNRVEEFMALGNELDKKFLVIKKGMELVDKTSGKISLIEEIYHKTKGKVEEINETEAKIKASLSVLTESKAYIDQIDKYIKDVKREFKDLYSKNSKVDRAVTDLEDRLSFIENAEDKIKEVTKRFSQMDSFVVDLEKRTNQIEIARDRVSEIELRFETMQNVADKKIIELKQLMNNGNGNHSNNSLGASSANNIVGLSNVSSGNAVPTTPVRGNKRKSYDPVLNGNLTEDSSNVATLHRSTLNNENRQEAVIKLYEKGFDIERISTLLNLSKSEVKLIIDVDKSKT